MATRGGAGRQGQRTKDSAVLEDVSDHDLDLLVRPHVHRRRALVHHQQTRVPQDSAALPARALVSPGGTAPRRGHMVHNPGSRSGRSHQAEQLALADAEGAPAVPDLGLTKRSAMRQRTATRHLYSNEWCVGV
jgi:hypothetical protein